MAYSWVKYSLELYTRSGHSYLATIPFFAIKMSSAEYTAFQNKYNGYSNKTLIESNGNVTNILSEMLQEGITRSPAVYARLEAAANETAKVALDIALQNARIVLPNSRDISDIFFSNAPVGSDLQVSYSLDGGNTIYDNGAIGVTQGGGNYSIHIYGDIAEWIGYAAFSNTTSPDIALPIPVLVEGGSPGYNMVVMGGPGYGTSQMAAYWMKFSMANSTLYKFREYAEDVEPEEPKDPYEPGGESGPGGGTGDFDNTGDDIDFPNLPSLSAVDTGFITLFNPSIGQLISLANYMWSDLFNIEAWKKIFSNPMDAILGLSIVPVVVPNGTSKTVSVGNISTDVTMNTASSQYVEVDCGTLNVNEYWGAYLDYDPYTKAEIYLPYVGIHPISVDDIMNKPVHVKYHVDILSGACCAYVKCGGSVLYSFVGQCSCSIPITGNDWTNVVNGALSIAGSIGTMVATGGASAPMSASAIASTVVNSMKPTVEKSGALGGMGGMLGVQTPYLILTRPRQALPKNQNKFSGYPSFITKTLGDCAGYTEIESIHLDGIPATEQELSEIENLLKGGVIL